MGNYLWHICFVGPDSPFLVDRTGNLTVATTDFSTKSIYLSNKLSGEFLRTVFTHELGHVTMFSYGLIDAIHAFARQDRWIEAEEWICNFIADYGSEVLYIANHILSPLLHEIPS